MGYLKGSVSTGRSPSLTDAAIFGEDNGPLGSNLLNV
jgi:hypothetical protein